MWEIKTVTATKHFIFTCMSNMSAQRLGRVLWEKLKTFVDLPYDHAYFYNDNAGVTYKIDRDRVVEIMVSADHVELYFYYNEDNMRVLNEVEKVLYNLAFYGEDEIDNEE